MSLAKVPLQVSDYLVLPLTFKPCKGFPEPVDHYLYLRSHDPKLPTPETPRSLFLVNIPIDTTELHLKHLFSAQLDLPSGRIEAVQFEGAKPKASAPVADARGVVPEQTQNGLKSKKRKRDPEPPNLEKLAAEDMPAVWDREIHKSGSTAVVVFVDRASMEAAFKAAKKSRRAKKTIFWGDGIESKLPPLGSARYLAHRALTYPPKAALLASVDTFMTAFAANEAAQARAQAKQRQEPDEDGFITVTRGGRSGSGRPASQEQAREKAERHKKKNKGFEDFYRFQTREKQKERAKELVRKFEEDKERVRKMRERRGKFKPE